MAVVRVAISTLVSGLVLNFVAGLQLAVALTLGIIVYGVALRYVLKNAEAVPARV